METQELLTHHEELKEIFDSLPSAFPLKQAGEEIKCINLSLLETIVSKMMSKAYYRGNMDAMNSLETMVNDTFGKH